MRRVFVYMHVGVPSGSFCLARNGRPLPLGCRSQELPWGRDELTDDVLQKVKAGNRNTAFSLKLFRFC